MLKHLITCLTVLIIITGCKKNKQEEAVLRIVTSADQAPFEFFNSKTHSIEGFDIDLAKELAKRLNMEAVVIDMDFGGILPSLQSGQADMAIAGITRTTEREQTIDFTNDYYQPKVAMLSLALHPIKLLSQLGGHKAGAQLGTFHQMLLEEIASKSSVEKFEIVARNRLLDLVQELLSGNIQAVFMDYIPATKFEAANARKLVVAEVTHTSVKAYAIALPKGSVLKEKINTVLKQLIDEGFIKQLEQKWLSAEGEQSKQ
ncbi:MAG: ABC transporter substrate-binding protein [Alphaproteobacteria bacterium]|nr:ABC transporter substrate-binding protein [Alphaproteobacteria bacterium]